MVSERTRAALAVCKRQGARLGNGTNLAAAQRLGAARTAEAARHFAANAAPLSGVPTARGGCWAATQVSAVLARAVD